MKKEILELIRERLIKVEDNRKQVDILQYFIDIDFFMTKVNKYEWLSSRVPKEYHDLSIRDFVDLGNKQLEMVLNGTSKSFPDTIGGIAALKELYSIKKYNWTLENCCKIIDDVFDCSNIETQKNECNMFAEHVLKSMNENDALFNAGVALFHDDDEVQKAAKQYMDK